jgi:hypothetical protein
MTGLIGGLGSLLGGGTTPEEQQRSAIFQAGLAALASAQQPGGTFGGSLFSGFQAGAGALQQAQQNAFQSKRLKAQEEREDRLEEQQNARIKLDQDAAAAKAREQKATVAQRVSSGIGNAKGRELGYLSVIRSTPEFQGLAKEFGFDPNEITTDEQVLELGVQLGAMGGIGAEAPKREPGEPLEAIIENGKPVLRSRSKAEGQTPYYRPSNALAVTLPDGTVISDGPPGAIGPNELTRATTNKLQESIIQAQDRLDRVNQTLSTYKPEFLQAKGLLKAKTGEIAEFFGGELDPESKRYLAEYSEFRATAANDFNQTLRDLSGAAVTDGEAKRALQAAPSPDDRSPSQFEAKAKATTKTIRRAILRANYALKNGIGTKSVDELSKLIPLDAVDAIYEARANQIFEELGGTEDKRQEAIQRANQEFGVAR